MLFLDGTNPQTTGGEAPVEQTTAGKSVIGQAEELITTFKDYVAGKNVKQIFENINEQLTTMEDSALALQRSMGGVAVGTDTFRRKLEEAFKNNLDINATFKDAVELVGGLASEMGRVVNPSQEVTELGLQYSKAVGETTQNVGKMIGQFSTFGGTQKESLETMSDLGKSARKSGLDAKSFTSEVAKNLDQASRFGFANGVKDIEAMVKKTKLLRTSLESLGIGAAAENLLDPEKALETASSIQMIGGNIGALGDPFQLLYMGQRDMKKLTDEVLNMAKATYTFDKETGAFTQTTEDMYALKAASQALGINYEETAKAGKELAKIDFIKSKTKLADAIADEDTQNLVAGLAQIDKAGNVSIDLPGLDKSFSSLDDALKDPKFIDALEDYQKKAAMDDKTLALNQMSIAEKQAADVNEIKYAVFASLDDNEEREMLRSIKENSEATGNIFKKGAEGIAPGTAKLSLETDKKVAQASQTVFDEIKSVDMETLANQILTGLGLDEENNGTGTTGTDNPTNNPMENSRSNNPMENSRSKNPMEMPDGFFENLGSEPIISTKDGLFKPRLDDQIAVGTSLLDTLMEGEKATNLLLGLTKQNTTTQNETKQEVSGKIEFGEIRIKVDAPNVDTSILEKTLNSKSFTDQIMSMVANQKSYYRNQSTLEG
jgi:hypothetical protein